jgi:acetyl esterase/lipase
MIMDEMNRANLPRVLGELMYLFERRDEPIDLMFTESFQLPSNLRFNGSHDSLAPVAGARAFSEQLRAESRAPVVSLELPGAQHAFEVFHSPRTHHVVHAVHRFLATIHAAHLAR